MLIQSLFFILQSAADLLAAVFLLRLLMQWARVPFRNSLGTFVIAATDWAVLPARKMIPGLWGIDLASLLLAWLVQGIYAGLIFGVTTMSSTVTPGALGLVALMAVIETVRVMLYLIFAGVMMTAILSWVNPHAPMAPMLNTLTRPFLAPFQRLIPPLGGVDLSPLVLIILLQLLLGALAGLHGQLLAL